MEVITEILSALPVKSLLRFSCVNKSFDALISDPYFIQKHLKKSKRNPCLAAVTWIDNESSSGVILPKISDLLDSSYRIIVRHLLPAEHLDWSLVGSCNGLLCLNDSDDNCLYIWNPSTESERRLSYPWLSYTQFSFGYDTSTETYKAVSFGVNYKQGDFKSKVKVFSFGRQDSWRKIQPFPVIPIYKFNGVHLNGIINWLALRDYSNSGYFSLDHSFITHEDYVIISLDLSTDTYTQLLLPQGFDKAKRYKPIELVVLRESLCFCHDFEKTHLMIWQMKDFGVQESWIQLFKINYNKFFPSFKLDLLPLYLSDNGDTLLLANSQEDKWTVVYNCAGDRAVRIGRSKGMMWSEAQYYVESLVQPY